MKPPYSLSVILGGVFLFAALSLAATNSVSTNAASASVINLFWGALPGMTTCSVKGDGHKLTYEFIAAGNKNKVEIVPTKDAWEKFWKAMDQVHLWKWQERYDNPHIRDGLVWSADVRRGQRKVRSGGSNGYPTLDRPSKPAEAPTELFRQYQQAVEELIGRKLWEK